MFEALTEKLTAVFARLTNRGRLTDKDVDEALREVRLALLEADVHFRVARELVDRVRQRSVGSQLLEHLNPGQQVVKVVQEELTRVLEGEGISHRLESSPRSPAVAMLVGLQGSGKTTTAAKLALHLRHTGHRPLLVAADLRRPAAVQQLVKLGRSLDIPVHSEEGASNTLAVSLGGLERAQHLGLSWVVLDTGGRLHIDDELMRELEELKEHLRPTEVMLVVDAMTGQDAVVAAQEFHQRLGLTGLILTKADGDARGGAALSITQVTGVPIKFLGTGERPEALEPFYADRLASRILGMGDVLTLIEKAQATMDQQQAQEMERKLRQASFDLEDFLQQLRQVQSMGPVSQLLEMVPGLSALSRRLPTADLDSTHLRRVEAIICSMTPQERRHPETIDGSRRKRIAKGSGTSPQEVNQLLNQFRQMQKVMKQMASGKGVRGLLGMLR